MTTPPAPPEFDPEYVRDISLAVYLERLGPDGTAKAVAELGINIIRGRAGSHDTLTKAYLRAIGKRPPPLAKTVPLDVEQIKVIDGALERSLKPVKQRSKPSSSIAKPQENGELLPNNAQAGLAFGEKPPNVTNKPAQPAPRTRKRS